MNWRDEELRQLGRFLSDEEVASQITQLLILWQTVYKFGLVPHSFWPVLTMTVSHYLFSLVHKCKPERRKVYAIIALSWAAQGMILVVALTFGRDALVANVMLSTLILAHSEVTPLLPWGYNLFAVSKHVLMWHFLSSSLDCPQAVQLWSILPSFWCVYHVTMYNTARQQLLSRAACMENLRDEQEKLVSLVLAIPDGVVVVTEDQKIAAYNHMFLEQMGLGQSVSYVDLFSQVEKLQYDTDLEEQASSKLIDDILQFIRSNCSTITNFKPVLVGGRQLEWRGKLGQWDDKMVCIATVRDSSQWVALEKKAKNESLQKSALLRSVSHELRTPANAVINQSAQLLDKAEDEEVKAELEIIISSAKLLDSMISDLLDLSFINYGMLKLSKSFFRLQTAMEECFQLIVPQCKAKELGFSLLYDPQLPETIYSDESRLKQVILHLLSNAVK